MSQGESNQTYSHNTGYAAASALEKRLNFQNIIDDVEIFLRGQKLFIGKSENGEIEVKKVDMGKKRCNEAGVQALVARVTLIMNNAVVQGNYEIERYQMEICQIRRSISKSVMVNRLKWDIDIDDYMEIVDSIMTAIKAVLSRTIDNLEREGYTDSVKSSETIVTEKPRGFGRT